jgi:hypothetical protein
VKESGRKTMHRAAVYGAGLVVVATAISLLRAVSHAGQWVVSLEGWQRAYVVGVIFLAPITVAVLLWAPYRPVGAWLLLVSMAGSFVFDLAYLFLIPGPDNLSTLQPGAWLIPFRASAPLLVVVSGAGSLVGVWAVGRSSRSRPRTPSAIGAKCFRRAPRTEAR